MCNSDGRVSQVLLYLEEICDPAVATSDAKRRDRASNADDAILTEGDGIAKALYRRKGWVVLRLTQLESDFLTCQVKFEFNSSQFKSCRKQVVNESENPT